MNILHITDELSKKNYSISSLVFFLAEYFESKKKFKHTILSTYQQKDLFQNQINIFLINDNIITKFISINSKLSNILKRHQVVHVHGIWRWINFLAIFHCMRMSIPFFIHPHGMLLNAALKNKGVVNYLIKLFFLKVFDFISLKNINFVSITNEESNSIRRRFKNSKIHFIPNPIPYSAKTENKDIKKIFVYFGRIHPIKNLELMINAFDEANLDKEWKLQIYGIRDDEVYFKKLEKIIRNKKNIIIKSPVFGLNKQKILSSSWANILLSKSEVLSLSVLESASLELPSLVNKDIEIDEFTKNEGVSTHATLSSVSKNLKYISNWTVEVRKDKGRKLKEFIDKNYSIEKLSQKYFNLYSNEENFKNELKVNLDRNYLYKYLINSIFNQSSFAYIFNLMVPSLMMVCLILSGYSNLGADVALINSFWISLTQVFSSNIRAKAISDNDIALTYKSLIFRISFSLILFLCVFVFYLNYNFFNFESFHFLFVFTFLILTQWIHEMVLASHEINKKILNFVLFNLINILLISLCIISIFFLNLVVLQILLFIYSLILCVFIINHFIKNNIKINKITESYLENLQSIAFVSSASIIFSSFAWKFLIYLFYPKLISSILFASFAIGSFPGTIFNSAIGPGFVKNKISLSKFLKFVTYFLLTITILLTVLSISKNSYNLSNDLNNGTYQFYTLNLSVLGSFVMTYAMYYRHLNIQLNKISQQETFKLDTAYGTIITLLLPLLYYFGNAYYVAATFFLSACFALVLYRLFFKYRSQLD